MVFNMRSQNVTCSSAVVCDEAGHVNGFAVDHEVPDAAHEISVSYWEILREIRNSSKEQGSCEVQRPEHT